MLNGFSDDFGVVNLMTIIELLCYPNIKHEH